MLGIKRQVADDDIDDDEFFPNGLTIPQKIWHVSLALGVLAFGLWLIWMTARILAALVNWIAYLLVGPMT